MQFNNIHANKGDGIFVDQPHPVVVKDNSVTCNTGSGVVVSKQGKVMIIIIPLSLYNTFAGIQS